MSLKLLLVNGPNLNMLGSREPEKYGSRTLVEIISECEKLAGELGYRILSYQSNHEGALIDFIQKEGRDSSGLIINAGAYTHTSVALRDAILSVKIPFVEVHLTNVYSREEFRKKSYLSDIAVGVISGFGEQSYFLGIRGLVDFIVKKR